MTKQDLAVFVGLAEIANKGGMIGLDAFQQVGTSVAKAKAAIAAMNDQDQLVIQKIQVDQEDQEPSESKEQESPDPAE